MVAAREERGYPTVRAYCARCLDQCTLKASFATGGRGALPHRLEGCHLRGLPGRNRPVGQSTTDGYENSMKHNDRNDEVQNSKKKKDPGEAEEEEEGFRASSETFWLKSRLLQVCLLASTRAQTVASMEEFDSAQAIWRLVGLSTYL